MLRRNTVVTLAVLPTLVVAAVPCPAQECIIGIIESLRVGTITIRGAGRSWNRKLVDEIVTRPGDAVSAAMLQLPEGQRFSGDKSRIR